MKVMDHTEYPKSLKSRTDAELAFISKDAKEAYKAIPDGRNASYYCDVVCYVSMERKLRQRVKAIRARGGK